MGVSGDDGLFYPFLTIVALAILTNLLFPYDPGTGRMYWFRDYPVEAQECSD